MRIQRPPAPGVSLLTAVNNSPLPKGELRESAGRSIIAGAMEERIGPVRYRFRASALIVGAAAALGLQSYAQEQAAEPPAPPPAADSQPGSSESSHALDTWLDALARAESGNRQRLVHRDRDGQLYYGCLQFQANTFRIYARRLHLLPGSSTAALMRRIYDCSFQKRLAAAMIRDDPSNWKHWRLTVEKRVGFPPADSGPSDTSP